MLGPAGGLPRRDPLTGPRAVQSERPVAPAPVPPGPGRLIGLDLGARRVGVAVCDRDRRLATGVTALVRRDLAADHRAVAEMVAEYDAVGVVVGLPLSLSGQAGPAAQAALREVDELRAVLTVPVDTVDERLTTVQASAGLRAGGRKARQQRGVIDQAAAAGLLQTWIDQHGAGGR
jgi:putative Holliday junction resolvase